MYNYWSEFLKVMEGPNEPQASMIGEVSTHVPL